MGFGIIPFDVHIDNKLNRFFGVTFCPLFTIFALWLMIDLINTKQIEVYRDRVVKRVTIPFPMQRDKAVYYKRAKYAMNWMGMVITEAKSIFLSITIFAFSKGFSIYTTRLKGKDEARFAKFLAQVSGRNEGEFLYKPTFTCDSLQKLIKE